MEPNMTAPPQVARTKPSRGPKLREARFEDYEQIAALESRFGLAVKPYNEWVHLWQGNPLYRELKTDWPIGWVIEDQDGKIVGSMGNIPFLYELDGRRILVASGHSWVADLEYRSASLLLLHNLIRQRHVDLYLNNTVGNSSVAAVTTLGCSRMPVGIWDEVAYWITNYRGFFERIVAMKKDRLAKTSVREGEVEVKPCTDFDDRFDSFWEDVKRNNRHLLLAVRTREVLEWH